MHAKLKTDLIMKLLAQRCWPWLAKKKTQERTSCSLIRVSQIDGDTVQYETKERLINYTLSPVLISFAIITYRERQMVFIIDFSLLIQ